MSNCTGTQELWDKLTEETAEIRYAALKELNNPREIAELKPRLLEIGLRDAWGPNRSEAVRALGVLWPDREVREAFCVCLDAEAYVANTVVETLAARMDGDAVELLRGRFVSAENAKLRYSILQAFCGAPGAMARLFVLDSASHADDDERIRALSLSLLARLSDPELKPLFVAKLEDPSQRVRAGAIEALSAICTPDEILELLPPYLEDSSNRVQANALIPLLKAGYKLAESKLLEMAAHTSNFFRSSAAYVLGEILPTGRVVSQLEHLVRDRDPAVRSRALASRERQADRASGADLPGAGLGMPARDEASAPLLG